MSVTGGFVYRGPIESLQGEYFFGDFNTSRVWSGRFDRDTAAFEFDGGNFYDLVERSFAVADDLRAGSPIDHLVSFGKDLDDNLLVVDYGEGNLFNPTPNTGEIFRLDAVLYPDINQDGVFNVGDWNAFKSNVGQDTSGMSDVNAYLAGDLDLDGSVGLRDAHEFAAIYDAQFGIDAFARDVAVPEPSSSAMLLAAMSLLTSRIIVSYRAFNAFPGIAPTSFTRRDAIQNTFVAIPTIRRNRRC